MRWGWQVSILSFLVLKLVTDYGDQYLRPIVYGTPLGVNHWSAWMN